MPDPYSDRFYRDPDSGEMVPRHLTPEQHRVNLERLVSCPTCGAKPGVRCISTSKSAARKRASTNFFEYAVHKTRKELSDASH